jgi:hypothetical protein
LTKKLIQVGFFQEGEKYEQVIDEVIESESKIG